MGLGPLSLPKSTVANVHALLSEDRTDLSKSHDIGAASLGGLPGCLLSIKLELSFIYPHGKMFRG